VSEWTHRAVSAADALAVMSSGMTAFVHGAAATPTPLLDALAARSDLDGVALYHLHTGGPAPFVASQCRGGLRSVSVFAGPPLRETIERGDADFIPIFMSDIPSLFLTPQIPLDVALLQLSPPDAHGYCTLGTSVDAALAASQTARYVIAEINDRMPRTHGNTLVPMSRIHAFIHTSRPLWVHENRPPFPEEQGIGANVASLVEDGATLQMGIGAIPDAVRSRRSSTCVRRDTSHNGIERGPRTHGLRKIPHFSAKSPDVCRGRRRNARLWRGISLA